MKQQIIAASVAFLLVTCSDLKRENVRNFIPGMYVRTFEHEFAKGNDTLSIRNLDGNSYEIVKRSGYYPIRNGRMMPLEYNNEIWSGIEKSGVIYEQRKGKVLSFVPEENKLLVGGTTYQKVGE